MMVAVRASGALRVEPILSRTCEETSVAASWRSKFAYIATWAAT